MQNQNKFLILAFFIGMLSLMYEIYIVKVIFLYFVENIYAVSITLSSFLAGLALSSYYVSRKKNLKQNQQINILLGMQVGMLTYAVAVLQNHDWIPSMTDFLSNKTQNQDVIFILKLFITWIFLLIPALFLGGALPLLTGLFQKDYKSRTTDTSIIYFWDTLGASLGALIVGIGFIPFLGIKHAFWIIVGLNLIIFLSTWRLTKLTKMLNVALGAFALIIGSLVSLHFYSNIKPSTPSLNQPLLNQNFFKDEKIVWQKNSSFGVVTVTSPQNLSPELKFLYINYRQMCNSMDRKSSSEADIADNTTQLMKNTGHVLNIGLGCGMTAKTLAQSSKVKALTIAEINPTVVEANNLHFKAYNEAVLQNPKTQLLTKDGAEVVRQASDQYFEAIVIDIEEPTIIHSSPLFTVDYFDIIKNKLKSDGVFSLWFFENPNKDTLEAQKIILNSLKTVFPYVKAYQNPNYNGFSFYASQQPFINTDINTAYFNFERHIQGNHRPSILLR